MKDESTLPPWVLPLLVPVSGENELKAEAQAQAAQAERVKAALAVSGENELKVIRHVRKPEALAQAYQARMS